MQRVQRGSLLLGLLILASSLSPQTFFSFSAVVLADAQIPELYAAYFIERETSPRLGEEDLAEFSLNPLEADASEEREEGQPEPTIQTNEMQVTERRDYWSETGSYSMKFHLHTWEGAGSLEEFQGTLTRLYPQKLDNFKKPQLFREIVQLYETVPSEGFSWLTIRIPATKEDLLWLYSPNLKRVRRLNGVNREDRLLGSAFGLDDLNFFSRNLEGLKLVEETELEQLVPFIVGKVASIESRPDGCLVVSPASLRGAEQLEFSQAPSNGERLYRWLSSEKYYPRTLTIHVFEALNPYRELTHEILIEDKLLKLPIYRMSYDVLGRLRYSSYRAYGLARGENKSLPAVVYSLRYDHEEDVLSVLAPQEQQWCKITEEMLTSFQPNTFAAQEEVIAPEATPKEANSEQQ